MEVISQKNLHKLVSIALKLKIILFLLYVCYSYLIEELALDKLGHFKDTQRERGEPSLKPHTCQYSPSVSGGAPQQLTEG